MCEAGVLNVELFLERSLQQVPPPACSGALSGASAVRIFVEIATYSRIVLEIVAISKSVFVLRFEINAHGDA